MNMWQFAATFFYLGKLPFFPGSWGSLGALILWTFLPLSYPLQLFIISLFFIVGVISSKKIALERDDHDPPEVVIDEAVGMGIALFMLPHSIAIYSIAFILFRIFDISHFRKMLIHIFMFCNFHVFHIFHVFHQILIILMM